MSRELTEAEGTGTKWLTAAQVKAVRELASAHKACWRELGVLEKQCADLLRHIRTELAFQRAATAVLYGVADNPRRGEGAVLAEAERETGFGSVTAYLELEGEEILVGRRGLAGPTHAAVPRAAAGNLLTDWIVRWRGVGEPW